MFVLCLLTLIRLSSVSGTPDAAMGEAVKHAVAGSFNGSVSLLHINIQTEFDDNKKDFLDMVDGILKEEWTFRFHLSVNNEDRQSVGDYNLWFIDSYKSFRRLLPLIALHGGDSPLFYFIVLKLSANDESSDLMHELFSDLFPLRVTNVNIMMERVPGEVLFYTYYPYQKSACLSTSPVLVNSFSNGTMTSRTIFSLNVDDLHNCPIRLAARNSPAFMQVRRFRRRSVVLRGLEGEIINELAKRMNFAFQYKTSRSWNWGMVSPNGTTTEFFKLLEGGEVDILVGAFYHDQYQDAVFTPSSIYFYSRLVIALHRPPYQLPKLSWLFKSFDGKTWLCFIVLLVITAACITLAKNNARLKKFFGLQPNHSRYLHILAVALGMPVNYLPRRNFLRLSFIIWSIGVLIIRAAYQGKLFDSYRRVIISKAPLNVSELLDDDYTIYSSPMVVDRLSGFEDLPYKTLVQYSVLTNLTEKNAVIGSESHIVAYFKTNELKDLIIEPIHSQQMCMYFQKHSVFARKFDAIIQRMDETGLLKYWVAQSKLLQPIKIMPQKTYVPGPINLERFKYILLSFSILYAAAGIVFIGEFAWEKFRRTRM